MKILILAAGIGKRMKSKKPKVLHEILEKPMINWVIDNAMNFSNDIGIVLGHELDLIKAKLPKNIKIYEQKEQLGTGHAVMSAIDFLDTGNILILYGDVPLTSKNTIENLIDIHKKENNDATILTVNLDNPFGYGRIIRKNNKFQKIIEHKDANNQELNIKEINSGIAIFNIDKLKYSLNKIDNSNSQKEYYLTDCFNYIKKVGIYISNDINGIKGVNDRVQLSELEKIAKINILEKLMYDGVTIIDPYTTYISPDVKIGKDSIIYPQTYIYGKTYIGEDCIIGPMTRIYDCEIEKGSSIIRSECAKSHIKTNVSIGPFARIRELTVLENNSKVGNFVETKKTILGNNSKASHLTYLGDSEIGSNVNIGAGTITCNYDGKNKHKTIIEDKVFIGSNTSLVAPIKICENSTIAAGSVITKNVDKNSLAFGRARQTVKKGWKPSN